MKKLLGIGIFFLCGISAFSQIYLPPTPTDYGTQFNRLKALQVLHIPVYTGNLNLNTNDTSAQLRINDGVLQYHYGVWHDLGGGGGITSIPTWEQTLAQQGSNPFQAPQKVEFAKLGMTYNNIDSFNIFSFNPINGSRDNGTSFSLKPSSWWLGSDNWSAVGGDGSTSLIAGNTANAKPNIVMVVVGHISAKNHSISMWPDSVRMASNNGDSVSKFMFPNLPTKTVNASNLLFIDPTNTNALSKGIGDLQAITTAGNTTALKINAFNYDASNTALLFTHQNHQFIYDDSTKVNVSVGLGALGSITTGVGNTVIGDSALSLNTTSSSNVVVGSYTLKTNIGSWNTIVGYNAAPTATTAAQNTAMGYNALKAATSAFNNTAIGISTMLNITSGSNNTAMGTNSLFGVTTGINNIGIGRSTMRVNPAGVSNVIIGDSATYSQLTGNFNTAIGVRAMMSGTGGNNNAGDRNVYLGWNSGLNSFGSYNTILGASSGSNIGSSASNAIIIGYNAGFWDGTTPNQVNIGGLIYSKLGTRLGFASQIRIDTLLTGGATDSVISVSGGVLGRISRSTIVPYTGATQSINLGNYNINANAGNFTNNGSTGQINVYSGDINNNSTKITASGIYPHIADATLDNLGLTFQFGNNDRTQGMTAYRSSYPFGGNMGMLTVFAESPNAGGRTGLANIMFNVGSRDNDADLVMNLDQAGNVYLQKIPSAITASALYYDPTTKKVSYGSVTTIAQLDALQKEVDELKQEVLMLKKILKIN